MRKNLLWFCVVVIFAGCSSSIRQLGKNELEVFQALEKRLQENENFMNGAGENFAELGAEYVEKAYGLELSLVKARLLESMKAPWQLPRHEFEETQRSVILYHLYDLELVERKLLDARMQERRVAAQEVAKAYSKLNMLLKSAIKNMKIVLQYLNQPAGAHIRLFTANFLREVAAFREELQKTENPHVQIYTKEISRYEEQVKKVKEQAEKAIEAILY